MDKVSWGILGAGGIAGLFTRQILNSGGHVEAVASRSLEKAQNFKEMFGGGRYGTELGQSAGRYSVAGGSTIKKAYGSYQELMDDKEIDVIYIATPHSDHHQWAIKCLNAGKHLLIEKAITRNYREAVEIFELARQKNLFVMEAMWTRFLPHIKEVKSIVESGKLGDIVTLSADFGIMKAFTPEHRLFAPELAGGALLDLGIYPIAFAHHILGVPNGVSSKMIKAPTGVDATVSMIFDYGNAHANLYTTSSAHTPIRAAISGTEGRIEINRPFYRPSTFSVFMNDGSQYDYHDKLEDPDNFGDDGRFGMNFEAAEVEKCLRVGLTESETMPHAHSLEIMQIMDNIRYEHNFKYPGE